MPCFGVDVMKIMPNNFQHFDHEILQAEIFFILDQIWVSGMCVCERERERVCVCERERQREKERETETEKYGHVYAQVYACLWHGREDYW